ncbi:MAG: methylenetetrahydrofolate reductase [NAD(P)H] [Bacteroidales bacterium]|nr:methylenetetrahydrofolate reductase [NAD(P)H] [Bacteroidales bacterium]
MKITDVFKKNKKTFSFEFFPPKDLHNAIRFGINAGQLMKLQPSFVSVTYGAGGSSRDNSFDVVDLFHNNLDFNCMAHYTCVNATHEKIAYDMRTLQDMGIENVMLLRGDPPDIKKKCPPNPDGIDYASDLIRFVRERYNFCIGAGAYPEKHKEAPSMEEDLINLRIKADAGADFFITQMFFNNKYYWEFVNKAEQKGIKCRIIPGIIPINSFKQIKKFSEISGASIPKSFQEKLEPNKDKPKEVYKIGLDLAIRQCSDLLDNGAPGIHFYTLNRSRAAVDLYENLSKGHEELNEKYKESFTPHVP